MASNGVCAVVITFHPNEDVLKNLGKIRPQVEDLVMVDNGSSPDALASFHAAGRAMNFMIVENRNNLGVAAALNTGIRWAESHGSEWIILFDQDSVASDGLVDAMMAEYDSHSNREEIAIVVPRYVDHISGNDMPLPRTKGGDILVARTSGSLMPIALISRVGYFVEDFVIDQVDYEYCLRLGTLGYRIVQCSSVALVHSLGETARHGLGFGEFLSTHHNAKRRYYMTRNRIRIIQLYWRQYPDYCLGLLTSTLKDTIKILLVEKTKYEKLKNTAKGVRDALIHRMGKTVEL